MRLFSVDVSVTSEKRSNECAIKGIKMERIARSISGGYEEDIEECEDVILNAANLNMGEESFAFYLVIYSYLDWMLVGNPETRSRLFKHHFGVMMDHINLWKFANEKRLEKHIKSFHARCRDMRRESKAIREYLNIL